MTKNVYGSGSMEVELDGKTYELVASPKAMKTINRAFGGFGPAFQAIQNMDVEALEVILRAGLKRNEAEDLEDKIFATGLVKVVKPSVEFLLMVQNGGKSAEEVEREAAEEEEKRPLAKTKSAKVADQD